MDDCETADKEAGRYCKQCGEFSFQPNKNRYGDRCRLRLAQLQLLKHVYSIPSSKAKDIKQGCHGQGKISGKCIFFPGPEKVGEFFGWPGKFRKNLESEGNVREFENKWLWQAVFRTFIYSVQKGKGLTFS